MYLAIFINCQLFIILYFYLWYAKSMKGMGVWQVWHWAFKAILKQYNERFLEIACFSEQLSSVFHLLFLTKSTSTTKKIFAKVFLQTIFMWSSIFFLKSFCLLDSRLISCHETFWQDSSRCNIKPDSIHLPSIPGCSFIAAAAGHSVMWVGQVLNSSTGEHTSSLTNH